MDRRRIRRVSTVNPEHRLCIAPMMDRTDRHCRYLLRLLAPNAWLYTEMITASALLYGDRVRLLQFDPFEHPVALQLGGSEPDELAAAARWGEEAGYDEINLNVGCPSGRVQAGCFGAALMLDAPRVADCVAAMRDRVTIPVTVKTRLGVDDHDSYEFLCSFVDRIIDVGCRTLIVHARKAWLKGLSPKQNREIPALDYERVYRLKRDYPHVQIVINGGLTDTASVNAQLPHVDGVMLGRAAYNEPMLIARLDRELFVGGARPLARRETVLRRYWRYAERQLDAGTPLRAMTRPLMGLYSGEHGGRVWRRELSQLPEGTNGLQQLGRLFQAQAERCTDRGEVVTMREPTFQFS